MLTGLWAAATLTGTVVVGIPRLALVAHLDALLGGLWLLAVAWSFEFLHYSDRGLRRLAIGVGIPAWSNWLVTLFASFLGVTGLTYTGHHANDVIAILTASPRRRTDADCFRFLGLGVSGAAVKGA